MHWIDPNHLPEVSGDAAGMMLTDGTEIHFPGTSAQDVCQAQEAQHEGPKHGGPKEKSHGHGKEAAVRH